MVNIGAHVSISGGVEKAVSRQQDLGGTCGQIFAGSPRGWKVSEFDDDEASLFHERATEADIGPWIIHGTYLINFATPKDDLAKKSIDTVQAELDAAAKLGIDYYTFHPGSHTGAGEDQGIENVANRLSELEIPDDVTLLLENTAGSGTTVGKRFQDLHQMVEQSSHDYSSLGVCLDTCHLFAAGYEFSDEAATEEMLDEFDQEIGLGNLHYLHLNDSKHPFDSEKDEHEHIGEGEIGDDWFRSFLTNERVSDLPMVLETPEDEKGYAWNIEKVRDLANA